MKKILFFLLLLGSFAVNSLGQSELNFDSATLEKVKPSSVAWTWDEGVYQSKNQEPRTVYLLMNTGGVVELQLSKNFNELIKSWLTEHPNAEAIVTNTISGVSDRKGWKFKPVWIRDGDELLNVYLVRQGACRGQTMDMSANLERAISDDDIKIVRKKLYQAEFLAMKEKLGIWADAETK